MHPDKNKKTGECLYDRHEEESLIGYIYMALGQWAKAQWVDKEV